MSQVLEIEEPFKSSKLLDKALTRTLVLALGLFLGCQAATPPGIQLKSKTRFEYEWRRYQDLAPFKSIAVAGDPASKHVTGIAYAYPLPSMAVRAAITFCEERRGDRGIEEPCETYAIGDDLVSEEERSEDIRRTLQGDT